MPSPPGTSSGRSSSCESWRASIVPQSVRSTGRQRRVPERGTPGEAGHRGAWAGRVAEWPRRRCDGRGARPRHRRPLAGDVVRSSHDGDRRRRGGAAPADPGVRDAGDRHAAGGAAGRGRHRRPRPGAPLVRRRGRDPVLAPVHRHDPHRGHCARGLARGGRADADVPSPSRRSTHWRHSTTSIPPRSASRCRPAPTSSDSGAAWTGSAPCRRC